MGITDELRKWGYGFCGDTHDVVTAIADRIDAEHEKAEQDLIDANNQMEQLCECSIRLPVDADGVPIHVGDSIEIIGGEDGVAVAIELCEDGGWNVSMRPTGWDTPTLFAAESVRHHHAPTVEDVLREFAYGLGVPVADSYIAASAAKLRLAKEGE